MEYKVQDKRKEEKEGERMKEIHNAQIMKAELSGWNDGYSMLTYFLTLEMDNGFSLGYGMCNLGGVGQQSYAAEDLPSPRLGGNMHKDFRNTIYTQ